MPRKLLLPACREVLLEAETGTEKAAAGDGATETTEWADRREGEKEERQGERRKGSCKAQMYFKKELSFTFWGVGRTARTVSAVLWTP